MNTLGFLGVAHIHTPGFVKRVNERADQFKVKAVWDDQPARAKVAAGHLSCSVVDHYSGILSDDEIDAVVICSETVTHLGLVEAAAAARKHLFVEKPLGMDAADAYAMQHAIDSAGVIFQTGFFMRSMPVHRFLKELLEDGTLGTITRIRHSNVHAGAIGAIFDLPDAAGMRMAGSG